MRRVLLGALVLGASLSAVPFVAAQQSAAITESVLVPPVFTVGDPVEMRVTVVVPEGRELRPIQTLPAQDWLVFRDVQIRNDPPFYHVTIKFVPFAPGEKVLPALAFGDVTLDALRIVTSSVLEKTGNPSTLSPPRDQLALPHTELTLFILFLLLIVLPVAAWRFARPALVLARAVWKLVNRRRPYHRLLKDLKKMQARLAGLGGPEFHTQLLVLVRTYLSSHFGRDFSSLTASEVGRVLEPLAPGLSAQWARLIHKADVVRFDSREPVDAERQDDLEAARAAAKDLEDREVRFVDL